MIPTGPTSYRFGLQQASSHFLVILNSETVRHLLLITVVGVLILFTNLGRIHLWDRDEPRNAGCAYEMMLRGDWVTPVFNAELRTHKPILLYWLIMAAYALFGVCEFAARFWSAVSGLGTMIATYWMGRRLFGAGAGMWAALALGSTIMFDVAARAATPDAILMLLGTCAMLLYVRGSFSLGAEEHAADYFPQNSCIVLSFYGLLGLGLLAKGPVGLVLPMAAVGMYMLIMRRKKLVRCNTRRSPVAQIWGGVNQVLSPIHFLRTFLAMRPITGVAVAAGVAAPWYWLVGVRTDGAWIEGFFLEHNLGRALHAMEGHHGGPWFYPVALLVGFFPWSTLVVPVVLHAMRISRASVSAQRGVIFCLCWLGVYVVLFSLADTKLPSYITPAYPAVAMLVGSCLDRWSHGTSPHRFEQTTRFSPDFWFRWSWCALGVAGVVISLVLAEVSRSILPGAYWLVSIGLMLVAGAVVGWKLCLVARFPLAAWNFLLISVLFCWLLFSFGAAEADRHQHRDRLLALISHRSTTPRVAAFGQIEPSWVFYGRRPIHFFAAHQGADLKAFLAHSADSFAITTEYHLQEHGLAADDDLETVGSIPYFLRQNRLVLLQARQLR